MASCACKCEEKGCSTCCYCNRSFDERIAVARLLGDYTSAEIRAELTRRRDERRKQHRNAKTNNRIKVLEYEIGRLKKELI
jgi:hypothetical protein